ncbi:MAG: C10 family peptidase [Paludibacteraceae bacterium]|nr:C10 family peptidase [Paludibacteraceae bacterium]
MDDMPANAAYWLQEYENQIRWNIESGHTAANTVTREWQHLGNMMPTHLKVLSQNAPQTYNTANLMTTTWAQNPRYNDLCPYDSVKGQRTVTGCVATAMAQIMKYWEHPLRGVGSYSYNDPPYGWQSADFSDTTFNYALMPDKLDASSTQAQRGAVALLIRRCGIAVEMEYGTSSSSAATIGTSEIGYKSAENALRENFKYMHTLHSEALADYTDGEWVALLQNEINNGRPAIYSAGNDLSSGGHSFICSGYDNTGKLYFNWGWNGSNNGYFEVGQLNPKESHHYNQRNKAIIGIEPDTADTVATTVTLSSNIPGACTLYGDGTYTPYVDTVTIMALANPGYNIDGWTDGFPYNPYGFIANGGNISHTANCIKITGDTVGYCKNGYSTSYGSGSSNRTHKWGIRIDSASIAPQSMLDKVEIFFSENGNHAIDVCYGNDTAASSAIITSKTANISGITGDGQWQTIQLPNPVAADRSKSIWITISWTGQGYPMSCSQFRGNRDGSWKYDNSESSWYNYITDSEIYISWMIRGIFAHNPGPYKVNVVANDSKLGTTTGSGTYAAGTTVTISATPNAGCNFLGWNDGVTALSRTMTVTDAITYTALFEDARTDVENTSAEKIAIYSDGNYIITENAEGETAYIYDAAGRLLMTKTITSSHETIPTSLPAATYFVKINDKTIQVIVNR